MKTFKYSKNQAKSDLPIRSKTSNKSNGGKCLIVAGSTGMYGAAILSAVAAGRVGAGYVFILSSGKFPIQTHPEFLILNKLADPKKFNSIAIGPGYKNHKKILSLISKLKKINNLNVVLDAEAINVLAKNPLKLPKNWIVTPHEGELGRILNISDDKIRKNRIKYIELAYKKLGCIILLKGFRTLICDGKNIWEIQSGNPALAKAGTGDVLTGIIAGLLSQNLKPTQAALLGAYIHGDIADSWVNSSNDNLSLLPSDILNLIPKKLKEIRK